MVEPREKLGKLLVKQLPTNTDLIESIKKVCVDNGIQYATILSTIGSLHQLKMEGVVVSKETRSGTDFAPPKIIPGPLQVLNLDGIIFTKGETGEMDTHIHGSFVDTEGKVYGGHVMEEESIIATRLVVVIAEISEVSLTEQYDEESGHRLLHVEPL